MLIVIHPDRRIVCGYKMQLVSSAGNYFTALQACTVGVILLQFFLVKLLV